MSIFSKNNVGKNVLCRVNVNGKEETGVVPWHLAFEGATVMTRLVSGARVDSLILEVDVVN